MRWRNRVAECNGGTELAYIQSVNGGTVIVFDILITIMSLCLIGVMGGLLHIFCATILGRKEVAQARDFGHPLPPAGDSGGQ